MESRITQIEEKYHSKHQLLVEQLSKSQDDNSNLEKKHQELSLEIKALSERNSVLQNEMKEKTCSLDDLRSKHADISAKFNTLLEEKRLLEKESTREKEEKVLLAKSLEDQKTKLIEAELHLKNVQMQLTDQKEKNCEAQQNLERNYESKILEMKEMSKTQKKAYSTEIESIKSSQKQQEKELQLVKDQNLKLNDLYKKASSDNKVFQNELTIIEDIVSNFQSFDDTLGQVLHCSRLRNENVFIEKQRYVDFYEKNQEYLRGQENDLNILDRNLSQLDSILTNTMTQKQAQSDRLFNLSAQVSFLEDQIAEKDNQHQNKTMSNLKEMEEHLKKVMCDVKRDHEMEMKALSEEHEQKVKQLETKLAQAESFQEKIHVQSVEQQRILEELSCAKTLIKNLRDVESNLKGDMEQPKAAGPSTPSKQPTKSWSASQQETYVGESRGGSSKDLNPKQFSKCDRFLSTPERQIPAQDLTPATNVKSTNKRRRGYLDVSKKNLKEDICSEVVTKKMPMTTKAIATKPTKPTNIAPIGRRYTRRRNKVEHHSSGSQDSFNIFDNDC